MKNLYFAFISLVFIAIPLDCLAQKKQTQAKWFSVTTYDSSKMEVDGKVTIKDINEFLKFSCSEADPIFAKEILDKAIQSYSNFTVELIDGNTDANGKVLTTTLTVNYQGTVELSNKLYTYNKKTSEEKFFRDRNECMKERANLKLWLTDKNKEYRSSVEKYN